jgi:hypothetical protein
MAPEVILAKLRKLDELPDSALIELPVAAAHQSVSERTITRRYRTVIAGLRSRRVRLGDLRLASA